MKVATEANSRTTHAAQEGITKALKVSFNGGSIMGMSFVGLAMLRILIILSVSRVFLDFSIEFFSEKILQNVSGFSLGASSMALFARVEGGIFTKAADVGADLVGKVEAGIPEDNHRNPATIADNVGDNVGDVAGMGADLFESYVGSIVGAMILGAASSGSSDVRFSLAVFPLVLASPGVLAGVLGIRFVRIRKGKSPQRALNTGTFAAAAISAVFTFAASYLFLAEKNLPGSGFLNIFIAAVLGMAAGISLGFLTEYYTGTGTKPALKIVKACETGPATTLITGMGVGMASSFMPIVVIIIAIILENLMAGLCGVAISALGMLMILGIQLAVDAYGPIADNAGGWRK